MKKAIGLSETGIEVDIYDEQTGQPSAEYISFGKCFKDTAELSDEEGETVACECEELDDPEDEITLKGKTTLKYSTSDLDPQTCHKVFGGTYSAESGWEAPATLQSRTVALKFTTRTGLAVSFVKMKLRSRINWAIKKNGYGLIEHTLTALSPIKIK